VGARFGGGRQTMPEISPDDLAAVVRRKFAAGTLPREAPQRTWAGHGTGFRCSVCDLEITSADIEREADLSGGRILRFHVACFTAWILEAGSGA
jgi:hypothetical protein